MPQDNETLVIGAPEPIKSIEVKDGKARVGAYAMRFSGADQKDLQGEFFTAKTYFGSRKGDGADVIFTHGRAPTKGFDEICQRVFLRSKRPWMKSAFSSNTASTWQMNTKRLLPSFARPAN